MFISQALAQSAGIPGMGDFAGMILPLLMIMIVFYFLLIRPQQKRQREHSELINTVSRGDTVVTSGGIVGKVNKVVDDKELLVEIADNVKVRVVRSAISDVRFKSEPVKDEAK